MELQRRELKTVEDELELNRQQIEVTREQLRAHLELVSPQAAVEPALPTTDVVYESGSEIARDVHVWLKKKEARYGMACNTPSPSRRSHSLTITALPVGLAERSDAYFAKIDQELALTEDEWWAAVTWQAADKTRYCWMYVQRTDHVEQRQFVIHEAALQPHNTSRWRDLLDYGPR